MHYMKQGLAFSLALALSACSTTLTPDFGVRQGKLSPCPPKRDCISSRAADTEHHIAPIAYSSNRNQARLDLIKAIYAVGEARLVSNHSTYLRVEYPAENHSSKSSQYYYQPESALDEVEFYFSPATHDIAIRSIAGMGLFDVGANRERLEKIRAVFNILQNRH
ncbi:MAG TPA: DUF1499 domain-containing protein [Gammaproteobacteria bacterium]|nr:DUF1499 domain-containing protein [Gammaproteobacteria bacterium]